MCTKPVKSIQKKPIRFSSETSVTDSVYAFIQYASGGKVEKLGNYRTWEAFWIMPKVVLTSALSVHANTIHPDISDIGSSGGINHFLEQIIPTINLWPIG